MWHDKQTLLDCAGHAPASVATACVRENLPSLKDGLTDNLW